MTFSCSKSNSEDATSQISKEKINLRSQQPLDIPWLQGFQDYLNDVKNSNNPTNTYNVDEASNGIEMLLNLRYADETQGISQFSDESKISVPKSSNWLDLLGNCVINLKDDSTRMKNSNTSLLTFIIQLDSISVSDFHFVTQSIYTYSDLCINTIHNSSVTSVCDDETFTANESYYLWAGGFDGIDLLPNEFIECPNQCGESAPCTIVENFALEQIESRINLNYPEPSCPPGLFWDGTYSDIQFTEETVEWDSDALIDCLGENIVDEMYPCACFEVDRLNCLYCKIWDEVGTINAPITIPQGYDFISINLGSDYFLQGQIEFARTRIDVKYYYGIRNCIFGIVPVIEEDRVLDMDLNNWL